MRLKNLGNSIQDIRQERTLISQTLTPRNDKNPPKPTATARPPRWKTFRKATVQGTPRF